MRGERTFAVRGIQLIVAPFHGAQRAHKVGAGPLRLLEMGLIERLEGREVAVFDLGHIEDAEGEIGGAFEAMRRVARAVSSAVSSGAFPILLAGNCNAEVGMYAGLGAPTDVDIVWFDGHTDFYTPDTMDGGYFDSMGAATLTGQCWNRLAATVPGFRPLDPVRLIYCGSRDLETELENRIRATGACIVKGGTERRLHMAVELTQVLGVERRARLIHLDVDCLDPSEGLANRYAVPGGLMGDDLMDCLKTVLDRSEVMGLTVASYDPNQSGSKRIGEIAIEAIERVVDAALAP